MKRNLLTVGAIAVLVASAWVLGQQRSGVQPPPKVPVDLEVETGGVRWVLYSDGTVEQRTGYIETVQMKKP